jgi:hypothetical protein
MKRSERNWPPFVREVETAETIYQLVQEFLQMVRKLEGERASGLVRLGSGKRD